MTQLITDASSFRDQALEGFVASHQRHVRAVDGGVVRAALIPPGQVALVVGGGSGHYPAFAGLVGAGLASGAVCGNIFASPAAGQVQRVSHAVERGAGLLLAFGNYAGDMLQFSLGAERLRSEGMAVRIVTVTDDIASAPPEQKQLRRGIAGGLAVYKVAGAAAEAGRDLDAVEALAIRANARVRSLGVAFSGCTLPGAEAPLFSVPAGRMAVGMGLHGEPGLGEQDRPDAEGLATLLVSRLLAELPEGVSLERDRAVVLLNGFGNCKYEELFVAYAAVARRLAAAGVVIADSECGELVTSLDMAGLSLSLFWVDDELLQLWQAPADSPAYRRGVVGSVASPAINATAPPATGPGDSAASTDPANAPDPASAPGPALALSAPLLAGLQRLRRALETAEPELGRLDAQAGDGDHGLGMLRGANGAVAAAAQVLARGGDGISLLRAAAEAWSEQGGGTSGAIWGAGLAGAADALARALAEPEPNLALATAAALDGALAAVKHLGKAEPGDKTLVDALQPLAVQFREAINQGADLADAWQQAATAATTAAAASAALLPRLGRARPHAERSRGHADAGATSLALCAQAVCAGAASI